MRFCRFVVWVLSIAFVIGPSSDSFGQGGGKWTKGTRMPSSRTEVAAVVSGGKIYVIGGFKKGSDLVEEYDPSTDRWRRRASLPFPLQHVGA